MPHTLAPRRFVFFALLLFVLLVGTLGTVSASPVTRVHAKAIAAAIDKTHAPAGGGFLPVFQFLTPQISDTDTANLAQRFAGIYQEQSVGEDEYLNNTRFTVPNTETNTILEQYGATSGFYAYQTTGAFGDTGASGPIVADDAEYLACQFLLQNELFPQNVQLPDHQNCDFNPSTFDFATVRLAHATDLDVGAGDVATDTIIAAEVQVPMSLDLSNYNLASVPLGGAGGHISLLFRTTDYETSVPSLDDAVPGLAAVAMPFYGREFEFYGQFPAVDPAAAQEMVTSWVQDSYPNATDIVVPTPVLMYMVNDAAVPQKALEPDLVFQGIQVMEDGHTTIIKDIQVPATEGFAPSVRITAPANGTTFTTGELVTFTGAITPGMIIAAPYTYTWSLDDGTVLMTGTVESTATVTLATSALPVSNHEGILGPVVVRLSVEDGNGAQRDAYVSLQPLAPPVAAYRSFLPQVQVSSESGAGRPAGPLANYSYGTEQGSDYPPYGEGGPDLGGVPGDVGGFRSGMGSLGWDQRFHWANALAWEKDWRDCSLGGGDCSYGVDRADFVFFSGHGGGGGISMPSNVDSNWFAGTNARYQNARWVAFSSCQTLRAQFDPPASAPIRDWFNGFQGAHMFLGFNSNMGDVEFGGRFVDNMRLPTIYIPFFGFLEMPWAQRTISDAWVQTAFQMNAGQPAYLFAVGTNGVNPELEKLPKANDPLRARPFPAASYNWVWWDE